MARRMFSPTIVNSDAFLDMPASCQLLYFHLGMSADDDGFVSSPKKILRMIGGNPDDLSVLLAKRFIIGFENGVIVIKHWKINNLIRKDWYKKTLYQEELDLLEVKDNGAYTEKTFSLTKTHRKKTNSLTQVRLGKARIGKVNTFVLSQGHVSELEKILLIWNEVHNQKLKSFRAIEENYVYWREVYEFEEIIEAIKNSPNTWLKGKPIETFFRRKNPNGERVDYISQALHAKEEKNTKGIMVIRE